MDRLAEDHLAEVKRLYAEMLDTKYRKGNLKHNQFLPDMPVLLLLQEALMENIDQYVYLVTAINKLMSAQSVVANDKN